MLMRLQCRHSIVGRQRSNKTTEGTSDAHVYMSQDTAARNSLCTIKARAAGFSADVECRKHNVGHNSPAATREKSSCVKLSDNTMSVPKGS